jgi:NO-binding membrane sensor protein with MHYT domain
MREESEMRQIKVVRQLIVVAALVSLGVAATHAQGMRRAPSR